MKKKLTLRIDEDVKEAAKRLARERGESLSGLVEAYFRILTEPSNRSAENAAPRSEGEEQAHVEDLGPVTRRIAGALGSIPEADDHDASKDEDRQAVIEAARRKHE